MSYRPSHPSSSAAPYTVQPSARASQVTQSPGPGPTRTRTRSRGIELRAIPLVPKPQPPPVPNPADHIFIPLASNHILADFRNPDTIDDVVKDLNKTPPIFYDKKLPGSDEAFFRLVQRMENGENLSQKEIVSVGRYVGYPFGSCITYTKKKMMEHLLKYVKLVLTPITPEELEEFIAKMLAEAEAEKQATEEKRAKEKKAKDEQRALEEQQFYNVSFSPWS